jgi:hypothetical protein
MSGDSGLERGIGEAMAQVRGARVDEGTADSVDGTLRELRERAETAGADADLTSSLRDAEAAFRLGDTVRTIQCLSRALMQTTRLPPNLQKKGKR